MTHKQKQQQFENRSCSEQGDRLGLDIDISVTEINVENKIFIPFKKI
jgi:hypothetical protein